MRDLIVVIPGILGSVLEREGKEVWGLSWESMIGNLLSLGRNSQQLALPQGIGDQEPHDGVSATRLMPDVHLLPGFWTIDGYSQLVKGLKARFTLNEVTADQPGNLLLSPTNRQWLAQIFPATPEHPHKPDVVVADFRDLLSLVKACLGKGLTG